MVGSEAKIDKGCPCDCVSGFGWKGFGFEEGWPKVVVGLLVVAVEMRGAGSFLISFLSGLPDRERRFVESSSESPSINNDSWFALEPLSASEESSTNPCDWACDAVSPLMTAGSVRPNRFGSTKVFEKTCLRRVLESATVYASVRGKRAAITNLEVGHQ